jgi:uncharacterized protein (DUF488 family)
VPDPDVFTLGHGTRPVSELVATLREASIRTLVDVRRFPGSRRNPQFGRERLAAAVEEEGIGYRHEPELGGRRRDEPGEERFGCIRVVAFRSYAARMTTPAWQSALASALDAPSPQCFLCAETAWIRCHRRLIADLLTARGLEVLHLLGPGSSESHRLWDVAEIRRKRLYLCGEIVA